MSGCMMGAVGTALPAMFVLSVELLNGRNL